MATNDSLQVRLKGEFADDFIRKIGNFASLPAAPGTTAFVSVIGDVYRSLAEKQDEYRASGLPAADVEKAYASSKFTALSPNMQQHSQGMLRAFFRQSAILQGGDPQELANYMKDVEKGLVMEAENLRGAGLNESQAFSAVYLLRNNALKNRADKTPSPSDVFDQQTMRILNERIDTAIKQENRAVLSAAGTDILIGGLRQEALQRVSEKFGIPIAK